MERKQDKRGIIGHSSLDRPWEKNNNLESRCGGKSSLWQEAGCVAIYVTVKKVGRSAGLRASGHVPRWDGVKNVPTTTA